MVKGKWNGIKGGGQKVIKGDKGSEAERDKKRRNEI